MEFFEIELNQELSAAPNQMIVGRDYECRQRKKVNENCRDVMVKQTNSCSDTQW